MYPGVPPVGVTVAVPFASPLQVAGVILMVSTTGVGWLTTMATVSVQPDAELSVTTTV